MTGPEEPIAPKVDDRYWFNYSETVVTKALDSRDQAAAKIQTLVLWLWGIYTTYTAVGFALSTKELPATVKFVIALTSAALIGVYWCTVWVQMPLVVSFDPRSPTDISAAYTTALKVKAWRLNLTLAASIAAAAALSLALILTGTRGRAQSLTPRLSALLFKDPSASSAVAVTVEVANVDKALLCVRVLAPSESKIVEATNAASQPAPTHCAWYTLSPDGLLQTSVPVTSDAKSVQVDLSWEDSSHTRMRLTRIIGAPDVPNAASNITQDLNGVPESPAAPQEPLNDNSRVEAKRPDDQVGLSVLWQVVTATPAPTGNASPPVKPTFQISALSALVHSLLEAGTLSKDTAESLVAKLAGAAIDRGGEILADAAKEIMKRYLSRDPDVAHPLPAKLIDVPSVNIIVPDCCRRCPPVPKPATPPHPPAKPPLHCGKPSETGIDSNRQ